MKKLITILWFAIILISLNSCKDDLPIDEPTESKIALICTASLNDTNGDELAQVDEAITYTYTFKNLGDEKITNLKLNDERLGLTDYNVNLNQLLPLAEVSISLDYTLTQDDLLADNISNQTTISGTLPNGTMVSDKSDNATYDADGLTIVNFSPFLGDYEYGYFVANQGPFNTGTGTITFIGNDGEVAQNIYQTANNNETLGNIAQSMTINNHKAYIVINNSHKVVVVNRYTFEKEAVIEGDAINNPRYMAVVGDKGYVSNWGNPNDTTDDFITVINLITNEVVSTIPVGEGPEKMLIDNDKIYVTLQGGYHFNNKIEVIDTTSDTIISTITVGDVPNSILKTDNAIWVLCGGAPSYAPTETIAQLVKIENDEVSLSLDFQATEHPNLLSRNGSDLYYTLNGSVYKTTTSTTSLPTDALTDLAGFYYYMTVKDGKLYTLNAGDFASEGTLKVFDLSNNTEIESFNTGIIPGDIAF